MPGLLRPSSATRATARRPRAGLLAALLLLAPIAARAQPGFVGVETDNTGAAQTSLSVNLPAGAGGDLLVAVLGVKINPSTVTPSGWNAVPGFAGFNGATCGSDQEGIACQLAVFWRFADGGEGTSVTFTWGGTLRQAAGAVLRYNNTDTVAPIGPAAEQNGASAETVTAPSIVTTAANSRVLRLAVAEAQDAESLLLTPPATERFNIPSFSPFSSGNSLIEDALVMAGSDAVQAAAGASGTAAWTLPSPGDEYVAASIAIQPPGSASEADLAIDKDDGETEVNPGDTVVYSIVASNGGPDDVTGATVTDSFPTELTCTWTCSASGSAACGSAAGAGDISESVDIPAGDSVTFEASCEIDGGATGSVVNTASVAAPMGVVDPDDTNDSDSDSTDLNEPPVAQCQDVTVPTDEGVCTADASIDDGSFDPEGDPITLDQSPAGPYGLGDTLVELTVTDDLGLEDSCQATVTVVDQAAPVVECNAPATIVPPDAPIAFTATATDNCSVASVVVTGYDCYKFTHKGKRIDKTGSCVVSISGDTVTVLDSGGVGDTIEWVAEATDGSGNTLALTCSTEVVNPGQGH